MHSASKLTPELAVASLHRSLDFYLEALGCRVVIIRPEGRFAYLELDGSYLMLKEHEFGYRFADAGFSAPYLRGVNFQLEVDDVDALYARVLISGFPVPIPLKDHWHRHDTVENGIRQFVLADPDGYLLRFFTNLGERPVPA